MENRKLEIEKHLDWQVYNKSEGNTHTDLMLMPFLQSLCNAQLTQYQAQFCPNQASD
jgi:hypothetical protein